jgi:hypothetical protein
MQASPLAILIEFLLKISSLLEKHVSYWFRMLLGRFEDFRNLFESI